MNPQEPKPTSAARRALVFFLKLGVAAALVFWLYQRGQLDFAVLGNLQADAWTATWLCAALAGMCLTVLLMTWRLVCLLRHLGIEVGFGKTVGLTLIGMFFSSVLPGLVGGDAMRVVYLCRHDPIRRAEAVVGVLMDRVFGLYALFLVGTLALLIAWPAGLLPMGSWVLLVAPAAVALLTAAMAAASWDRLVSTAFVRRLFGFLPVKLQDVVRGLRKCLRSPQLVVRLMGISLLNHVCGIMSFVAAGMILRDSISPFAHFVLDPLVLQLNMVPLTPGGIGLTEGAFSLLYAAAGSPNGAMVGLLGRLIQYSVFIVGGVGALVLVKGRPKRSGTAGEVLREHT